MDDRASREAFGIARGFTGTTTGDGTALTVTLGFRPKKVEVFNITDNTKWEKMDGMIATTSRKDVAGTITIDTTSAIQITDNGFVLSAAANANAKTLVWGGY